MEYDMKLFGPMKETMSNRVVIHEPGRAAFPDTEGHLGIPDFVNIFAIRKSVSKNLYSLIER